MTGLRSVNQEFKTPASHPSHSLHYAMKPTPVHSSLFQSAYRFKQCKIWPREVFHLQAKAVFPSHSSEISVLLISSKTGVEHSHKVVTVCTTNSFPTMSHSTHHVVYPVLLPCKILFTLWTFLRATFLTIHPCLLLPSQDSNRRKACEKSSLLCPSPRLAPVHSAVLPW